MTLLREATDGHGEPQGMRLESLSGPRSARGLRDALSAAHVCRNPHCRQVRQLRPGQPGLEGARDYCRRCYDRWRDAGFPVSGPPDPRPRGDRAAAANGKRQRERAERIARYCAMRSRRWEPWQAGRVLGVSADTTARYERVYQQQRREQAA